MQRHLAFYRVAKERDNAPLPVNTACNNDLAGKVFGSDLHDV